MNLVRGKVNIMIVVDPTVRVSVGDVLIEVVLLEMVVMIVVVVVVVVVVSDLVCDGAVIDTFVEMLLADDM